MTAVLHRSMPAAVIDHDRTTRTVTVRLCRWNQPRTVTDGDGIVYRETFPTGSLRLADDVHVLDAHHGDLIGRALPDTFRDDGDGPVVDLLLAANAAGTDTLALIEAGVLTSVSMEYEPGPADPDPAGVLVRSDNVVHGVAFTFRPAHDAPILNVRTQPDPERFTMPDTVSDTAPTITTPPAPADIAAAEIVTPDSLARSLDAFRDDLTRQLLTTDTDAGAPTHPIVNYRTLGEYALAMAETRQPDELLHRALADQITTNNPGVIPPAWLSQVQGIVDFGRPLIASFGRSPAPSTGMEVDWPYFDGDLATLVAEQLTEKTAITSVRVDLKKASEDLRTWAGGSDLSYQLIRRSSPSYRDAYMRLMMLAYATVTDAAAGAAAIAAATSSTATFDPATGDIGDLLGALFTASTEVESATGAPASFVAVSTDVFIAVGGFLTGLYPAQYGTQNAAGTSDARSLRVEVSGLPIVHDRHLPDGTILVSNTAAGTWWEDGPFTVTAEDVEKLGQNVAVWGMGTFGALEPGGIVTIGAS